MKTGTQTAYDQNNQASQLAYIVDSMVGKMCTAELVIVTAVDSINKQVDVKPLVMQLAADDTAIEHSVIHGLPFFRLQSGGSAIIIDPSVGDIGLCVFASNDITGVKNTGKESPPLSYRRFDYADGIYIGGLLNIAPTQFIKFEAGKITITTPELDIIGRVKANGKYIDDLHYHNGVQPGSGNSGTVV